MSIDPVVLTRFFIGMLLLLASAQFFGALFTRLTMPKVVGEIFGGLLLGPTCLGRFFPSFYQDMFLNQGQLLSVIYWFGVVLLMFTSGFEIEREFDKKDKITIVSLVIGTTVIPLAFGWFATDFFDLSQLIGPADNVLSLKLVITVALAVTSIPVISKIFMDLGIIRTTFAKITLATATIHDIILWVFVSIATGLVSSKKPTLENLVVHVLISVMFFAGAFLVVPRVLRAMTGRGLSLLVRGNETAVIAVILLMFTVMAGILDINIVFGAFLAGVVINFIRTPGFDEAKKHIKDFSTAFFVPVYFAVVGIKLDLFRHLNLPFLIGFIAFAVVVQTIAVLITAKALKYDWLSSVNLAVVLNDRGGPCIVLATLALDLGIINENFFVTLILLAIVTSLTAGSWLRYVLQRGWPLLSK